MESTDLESTLERLSQDQRLLDGLRADYVIIRKSRFYALHALWAGLKQVVTGGFLFPPATSVSAEHQRSVVAVETPESVEAVMSRLAAGWQWRTQQQPLSAKPTVSIIIPAFNQVRVTARCLQSIVDSWFESLAVEIILVDDFSSDETQQMPSALPGLKYVRNQANEGFILSCNRGAAAAAGRYICFLNNDTVVRNGWLDELVLAAERDDAIGAVGSKLLFPDGKLQEAGGIIWRDATGWNYGRGDDPEDARYNYTRDVDYCSGAVLLVRADLFANIGGFSETYAPAYFEDADLCFALRSQGYRVVYEPKSAVVHYEGLTSGTSLQSGVKRYQEVNRPKFRAKWNDTLAKHLEHDPSSGMRAARRLNRPKTLIMIDNYVPEFDKDSGSNKLYHLIKEFQNIGFDVIYAPDNYHRSEPYTSVLQRLGVEVLYRSQKQRTLEQALRERLPFADLVWIGRPEIAAKWMPLIRTHPALPIVYDTHDLHYLRKKRELTLKGITDGQHWNDWEADRERELSVIRSADVPITISELERKILEQEDGVSTAFVVPNVHVVRERVCAYEETSDILFIGGYAHGPNVDAALFLCNEIMPIVWGQAPGIKVTLLGTNPPAAVRELANKRIIVPGYVRNVDPYFERARVFVAPLRYGAGLKGKVGQAFSYQVPTVTTQIGAEGFGLENGRDALIADTAEDFAAAILRVYEDAALWHSLSQNGASRANEYSPERTRERLKALVTLATARRSSATATYQAARPTSVPHRVQIGS